MNANTKYKRVFQNWTIKRLIGAGSYGSVYEIERVEGDAVYRSALKLITIPQSDDEIKERLAEGQDRKSITQYYRGVAQSLLNENKVMAELRGNSNIVSYEDHQVIYHEDGIGCDILIRMELLTSFIDYMGSHQITENDVIRLGIDICKALELCERKNIIHRDIKPGNIFVSETGDFKLGDFGIARTIERTTGGLSKKGTYRYMAPEVYRGDPYGENVDIYSLGLVMYYLANDKRTPFLPNKQEAATFQEEEEALARRMRGEPIPAPRNASPGLASIILKACAYNERERYASASEMRRDLEALRYGNFSQDPVFDPDVTVAGWNAPSEGRHGLTKKGTFTQRTGIRSTNGDRSKEHGAKTIRQESFGRAAARSKGKTINQKTLILLISAGAAFLLILVLVLAFAVFSDKGDTNPAASELEYSQGDNEETSEVTYDVPVETSAIQIIHWDQDFSNSSHKNSDGTYSYDINMWVENDSDTDITGIAYKVINDDGVYVDNEDPSYDPDTPFYAEGFVAAGETDAMASTVTVSEEEYKKENPNHRLSSKDAEIKDVFPFHGTGYSQATGELSGPNKDGKRNNYNATIDNNKDTPVHKGAKIVAVKLENKEGRVRMRVSSSNGTVDREIPAYDVVVIGDAFKDPGLEEWPAKDYIVTVIDNEYSDGSHYIDDYEMKYLH